MNNRDRNFIDAKIKRRIEQVEQDIDRYLAAMDAADRTRSEAAQATTVRLKDKIEKLKQQDARTPGDGATTARRAHWLRKKASFAMPATHQRPVRASHDHCEPLRTRKRRLMPTAG